METPMWNRLKAILADFIQQADLVLLGLCCAATLYGMALIASATRYLNIGGIVRYVGVQGAAMVLGICAYIFMSMLDLERLMRRWKWLVAFNVVFIALLLTPFGVSDNTGNTAWLKFPFLPFSIGPAEVVKITFTLLLAKQVEWLPGGKFSRSSPSASQRCISSRKAARDFSRASRSGCPRLIRYESWGRICAGVYPYWSQAVRKASICAAVSGAATHWRWFFVKRAKPVAPIPCALAGAFSTPPAALTCAPIYFI